MNIDKLFVAVNRVCVPEGTQKLDGSRVCSSPASTIRCATVHAAIASPCSVHDRAAGTTGL